MSYKKIKQGFCYRESSGIIWTFPLCELLFKLIWIRFPLVHTQAS